MCMCSPWITFHSRKRQIQRFLTSVLITGSFVLITYLFLSCAPGSFAFSTNRTIILQYPVRLWSSSMLVPDCMALRLICDAEGAVYNSPNMLILDTQNSTGSALHSIYFCTLHRFQMTTSLSLVWLHVVDVDIVSSMLTTVAVRFRVS